MGLFSSLFSKPVTTELTVTSKNGFHLRPVAQFVAMAKTYPCKITASYRGKSIDAKGVNTLLSLSLEKESRFILTCQGNKAQEALQKLEETFHILMKEDKEVKTVKKRQNPYESTSYQGDIIYSGIAMAPLFHYQEKQIQTTNLLTYEQSIDKSIEELEELYNTQNNHGDIYLAQKELLFSLKEETSTLQELKALVSQQKHELSGTSLESKISDYSDILQRVEKHSGIETELLFPKKPFILFAKDLLPSQIEQLSQTSIKGVILKETTINSHTAILLRGAGIPSLVIKDFELKESQEIILDTYSGVILTKPSPKDLEIAKNSLVKEEKKKTIVFIKRFEKATTQSGKHIKVLANVTDVTTAILAKEEGALGIGLLRTEFLFKEHAPTLEMQIETYEEIFSHFDEVTIRTLDVGGDKALPYISLPKENNPFLGIRGIRLLKTHPHLIEAQLHAIFIASKKQPIKIMFPMISVVEEFTQAKEFAQEVAKKYNLDISHISFGMMIEVPSTLFLLKAFNEVVDFYSIGTNDLVQYLFAIERTHPTLSINENSSVIYDAIETIIKEADKPVSICGELAANPQAIPKLLKSGIEILSVSPKNIAKTKEEIRNHV